MTHIVELRRDNIDHWQFSKELNALMLKVQGKTTTRPIIITVQIGETRWVWNGEQPLP